MDAVAEVGAAAPNFSLVDLNGKTYSLAQAEGKVVVLNFWSAECPWALKGDEYIRSQDLERIWGSDVLHWRIASNANESKAELEQAAEARKVGTVLLDKDQQAADLFGALTTPHIFVIDGEGVLRYAGALNDATWRDPEPDRNYLHEAVVAAQQGISPEPAQTPGRGCTIVRYKTE